MSVESEANPNESGQNPNETTPSPSNGGGDGPVLTGRAKSNANLRARWLPGQSGNPHNRGRPLTAALIKQLTKVKCDKLARAIIARAIRGEIQAFNAVADRVEGPVDRSALGLSAKIEGGKIEIKVIHVGKDDV